MKTFISLDLSELSTVTGGAAAAPQQQDDAPPPRTWGQLGREYGAACVMGAGQALMFGGRPRSVTQGLLTAAGGCAMGVGMKAFEDVGGLIGGNR